MSKLYDVTQLAVGFCSKHNLKEEDAIELAVKITGIMELDVDEVEVCNYVVPEWLMVVTKEGE